MAKQTLKFDPKKPVCKALGCTDATQVKGYCRLHYLRSLKMTREEVLEIEAVERLKNRRKSNRLVGLDTIEGVTESETAAERMVGAFESLDGELDNIVDQTDLEVTREKEVPPELPAAKRKVG
jgi:hypothetical protein